MTALMIVAMGMYFSVVSSRSVQYAVFNTEQSYQSATSISDAIAAGLMGGDVGDLLKAINALGEGSTLSTNGNGFIDLSASGDATATKEDEDQIGSYSVDVTRLTDEDINGVTNKVFDIVTTVRVNGVAETVHRIVYVEPRTKNPPPIDQPFASTGYVPNDQYIEGGQFLTDLYFNTENAVMGAYGNKMMKIGGDIIACGSLSIQKQDLNYSDAIKDCNIYVRDTLSNQKNSPLVPKGGEIIVGRDFITVGGGGVGSGTDPVPLYLCEGSLYANGSANFHGKVYVGKDVYIEGNSVFNGETYIGGNLYLNSGAQFNDTLYVAGTIYVNSGWSVVKDIYVGGGINIKDSSCGVNKNGAQYAWSSYSGDHADVLADKTKELAGLTDTPTYFKWIVNDFDSSKDKYIPELDEDNTTSVKHVTLKFNYGDAEVNGIPGRQFVQQLSYDPAPAGEEDQYVLSGVKGCIIDDVVAEKGNNVVNGATLIIDTGDDPENVFTISVRNNRDFTGDGVNDSFSWYPFDSYSGSTQMTVLIKGRGSVVIDIPENVVYQDMDNVTFMHYNWFVLLGGTINQNGGVTWYNNVPMKTGTMATTTVGFIHDECDETCSTCSYTVCAGEESEEECPLCHKKYGYVECAKHEHKFQVCLNDDLDGDGVATDKCAKYQDCGLCKNRVGRAEIDSYLSYHPSYEIKMEKADDGSLIYPTTNIFLVSCEESADIRLSSTLGGVTIMQNAFYGYVYAPYMTFKGYGNNAGGGMVRMCGGMTVSDSILDDSMSYMACWPEKLPTELMGADCLNDPLSGYGNFGWKISLGGY